MDWMLNQSSIASEFVDHLSRMVPPRKHSSVQRASGSGIMLRNREASEPEMKGGFMCFPDASASVALLLGCSLIVPVVINKET